MVESSEQKRSFLAIPISAFALVHTTKTKGKERKMECLNKIFELSSRAKAKLATIPLLVLVVAGMVVVGGVAGLWVMFVSAPTTTTLEVRGLDATLMQAGIWTAYSNHIESTSLVDQMYGLSDTVLYKPDCAILVVDGYNLVSESLSLSIAVFEEDGITPYEGEWSCEPQFVEFNRVGGDGAITPDGTLGASNGPWTISYAEIEDMLYEQDAMNPLNTPTGDYNALLLSFTFPSVIYAEMASGLIYGDDIGVKIIVTLEVNDGQ